MPFVERDNFPSPAAREAAYAALAQKMCPECGYPMDVRHARIDSGATEAGHERPGDEVAEILECRGCDTEWAARTIGRAGAEGWARAQRNVGLIADVTGRHPYLAAWTIALTSSTALDPAELPVLVSAPLNRFPVTDAENDQIARRGMLLYIPPDHLARPPYEPDEDGAPLA